MNERIAMNADYWKRRYAQVQAGGGNYDTMITWTPEDYAKEVEDLGNAIIHFTGGDRFGKVIDFGCGRGRFEHLFKDYEGVDIVPELIEQNRKDHPGRVFNLMAPNPGPLPMCGAILAVTVLQHIDDEALREWLKVFDIAAANLFIIESIGGANEHTYRRDWTAFLKDAGYGIRDRQVISSREDYDFIWAT